MVMADFIEMNTNNINLKEITIPENLEIKEKSGEDLFLDDMSPWDCHVWHFLYRKDFLKERNISFIPNIIYEDIPFMHECFLKARRCLRIKYPMYIYRQGNTLSITSNFRKKSGMDLCFVLGELWKLTYQKDLSPRIVFKLKQNIYTSFSYLTYSVIHDISNNSERLEILKNIKHHAPEMYFRNGFRQKSVNFFIKRLPWAYLNFRVFYANHLEKRIWKIRKHIKRANTRTKIIQI